ncbi:MAG: xanthine dehydrogenase family protein subunit M [Calditrichaeota bacterium]|nr:MAG: xanthine dehydrogenase family protein subunit M [Calditrichota bacterium]
MKPPPFDYYAPTSLEEALSLLARHGLEAKPLAGGQSLIPTMNFRLARPAVLIDLNRIPELAFIREEKSGALRLGAMTRQRAVERSEAVAKSAPLLSETMPWIAHPQIRNRGTIGGSLAHADPAAELPAVMLALQARFRLQREGGERWVEAKEFFTGMFATALEPEELLTEIEIPPLPPRTGWAFREMARRHGDYALAGVAAMVTLDKKGRCREARIACLSVGEQPVDGREAAQLLHNQAPTEEALREVAEKLSGEVIDPPSDIHASAEFRRHLIRMLTVQALTQAAERAGKM